MPYVHPADHIGDAVASFAPAAVMHAPIPELDGDGVTVEPIGRHRYALFIDGALLMDIDGERLILPADDTELLIDRMMRSADYVDL